MCVLGEAAEVNLWCYGYAVGKFVKVNDNWTEVTGVIGGIAGATRVRKAAALKTRKMRSTFPWPHFNTVIGIAARS